MKKATLIVLAFLCAHILCSQPRVESIESLCKQLSAMPNTTGSFIQTKTITSINRNLKSYGTFTLCPAGIVWRTKKPFTTTLIIGTDFMAQIAPDGSESISDFSNNETFKSIASSFVSVLGNNAEPLKSNYDISFTGGEGVWSANLSPKDVTIASIMGSIALSGVWNDDLCEIRAVSISEKNGDKILYELTDQSHPRQIPKDDMSLFKRLSPSNR